MALITGIGIGGAGGGAAEDSPEYQALATRLADVEADRDEAFGQVESLEADVADAESAAAQAAEDAESAVSEAEAELQARETAVEDRERAVGVREAAVAAVEQQTPAQSPTSSPSTPKASQSTPKAADPVPLVAAPEPGSGTDTRYGTCKEAKSHGLGPYTQGVDPEYDWYRDADNDGFVCE